MKSEPTAIRHNRVLVVDDDLQLTLLYQQLLESWNYHVSTASDGSLALKHVLNEEVDAVVCDLRMTELDGDLFFQAVERAKPDLSRRFIFMTGASDDPKYVSFLKNVKAPVLHKPVPPTKLLAELEKLLGPRA